MKKILFSMLPLIILAACQDAPANTAEADVPFDEIAANLETPWCINKTGEAFYISERPGTIAHIDEEGTLTRQAVDFSDPLSSAAEAACCDAGTCVERHDTTANMNVGTTS